MQKKFFIVIGLVLVVCFGLIMLKILQPAPIWEINAKQFSGSFTVISGNYAAIGDLSAFTAFEWDTLYSFAPYTPEETIYEVVGYQWDKIRSTVSEGMNQIVFLKDSKVSKKVLLSVLIILWPGAIMYRRKRMWRNWQTRWT